MRKFSKIVLVTAAVLGTVGIGLSVGGAAMGASFTLDMLKRSDGSGMGILERWLDWDDDGWEEEHHEDEAAHIIPAEMKQGLLRNTQEEKERNIQWKIRRIWISNFPAML